MAKNDEDRYVVPNEERGGWDVVKENHQRASAHTATQAEAIQRAKEIVNNSGEGKGEVHVQGRDGQFRDALHGQPRASTDAPVGLDVAFPKPILFSHPRASLRPNAGEVRLRFYLGTVDAVTAVRGVLGFIAIAQELGYGPIQVAEVSPGSVWTEFSARVRKGWDDRKTRRAANVLRQTVEAWGVDRPLAANAQKKMEGAASFLDAVQDAHSVAADFGNVVIAQAVDEQGRKHVRVVSYDARDIASQKYPDELLRNPEALFQALVPKSESPEDDGGGQEGDVPA
jgi:hypothetical protein